MAIESDISNADTRLAVKFEKREVQDMVKTLEENRPIFKEVVFIKIAVPGDALTEIDRPMYEHDKNRFPLQWASYLNRQGEEQNYSGTSLKEWPLITKSQAEELRGLKFHTVESIAMATDQAIQKIGMLAGMSPYSFREKAQSFLKMAKEGADVSAREAELNALKEENAKIKAEAEEKYQKQQAQIEALMTMMAEKKRGRKPKEVESVE
jgi:hypothetical protein